MSKQITVTLDLGILGECDATVSYTYSKGRPEKLYLANGDPGYPAEPPEVEIESAHFEGLDLMPFLSDADSILYEVVFSAIFSAEE